MKNAGRNEFVELSRAKIQETRNIIISQNSQGDITMAQQIEVMEGQNRTIIFFKGAMYIDKDKLINLRDAINEALEKLENM